ncbi:MAG: RNA polymerase sigma factor [Pseudomonadota bacterium]|nr:RNA polymerase sigma factor [Pseudomonadota bacterium]
MLDRPALQRLFRYGVSLTRDEDAAYDLLQDALEISLRKVPDKKQAIIYFIQSIMRNRFIDQYRRAHRHPSVSYNENDDQPVNIDPRVLEDIVIAEREVESIMSVLDPVERELLYCWAVEGCTAQEIADRTDSPRGTVLSRIHRLRQKILKQQEQGDAAVEGGAR